MPKKNKNLLNNFSFSLVNNSQTAHVENSCKENYFNLKRK